MTPTPETPLALIGLNDEEVIELRKTERSTRSQRSIREFATNFASQK